MDSLQLRVSGFFVPFVVRPSSPRILPVCYAAFCLLLIYVFTYRKKIIKLSQSLVRNVLDYHE